MIGTVLDGMTPFIAVPLTPAELRAIAKELRTLCVNPEFADTRSAASRICQYADDLEEQERNVNTIEPSEPAAV